MAEVAYVFPVSFAQQRLWFLDRVAPGNPFYNIPLAIPIQTALDVRALGLAVNAIAARHESLRTTFKVVDGEPCQIVHPSIELKVPVTDLRGFPPAERDERTRELALQDARQPFDLESGPLVRCTVLARGVNDHVLLLSMHHIISDGWSMGILAEELTALYQGFVAGYQTPLRIMYSLSVLLKIPGHRRRWLHRRVGRKAAARRGCPVVATDLSTDLRRLDLISHGRGGASPVRPARRDQHAGGRGRGGRLRCHARRAPRGLQLPFCARIPPLGAMVNVVGTVICFEAIRAAGGPHRAGPGDSGRRVRAAGRARRRCGLGQLPAAARLLLRRVQGGERGHRGVIPGRARDRLGRPPAVHRLRPRPRPGHDLRPDQGHVRRGRRRASGSSSAACCLPTPRTAPGRSSPQPAPRRGQARRSASMCRVTGSVSRRWRASSRTYLQGSAGLITWTATCPVPSLLAGPALRGADRRRPGHRAGRRGARDDRGLPGRAGRRHHRRARVIHGFRGPRAATRAEP